MLLDKEIEKEFNLKAIRSSGSGGQHVNKVATKIELSFNVELSQSLTQEQKEIIIDKLAKRLTKENVLIIQCSETRSQLKNKRIAIQKAISIIEEALVINPERKPTDRKSVV